MFGDEFDVNFWTAALYFLSRARDQRDNFVCVFYLCMMNNKVEIYKFYSYCISRSKYFWCMRRHWFTEYNEKIWMTPVWNKSLAMASLFDISQLKSPLVLSLIKTQYVFWYEGHNMNIFLRFSENCRKKQRKKLFKKNTFIFWKIHFIKQIVYFWPIILIIQNYKHGMGKCRYFHC